MDINQIDVKENVIRAIDPKILAILLKDKTTRKNIIWATDDYISLGEGYAFSDEITIDAITGDNGNVIRPRTEKSKEEQSSRSREKAEVFTPSWVCNRLNIITSIINDYIGIKATNINIITRNMDVNEFLSDEKFFNKYFNCYPNRSSNLVFVDPSLIIALKQLLNIVKLIIKNII